MSGDDGDQRHSLHHTGTGLTASSPSLLPSSSSSWSSPPPNSRRRSEASLLGHGGDTAMMMNATSPSVMPQHLDTMDSSWWPQQQPSPRVLELMLVLRQSDGTILQASQAFRELTGFPAPPQAWLRPHLPSQPPHHCPPSPASSPSPSSGSPPPGSPAHRRLDAWRGMEEEAHQAFHVPNRNRETEREKNEGKINGTSYTTTTTTSGSSSNRGRLLKAQGASLSTFPRSSSPPLETYVDEGDRPLLHAFLRGSSSRQEDGGYVTDDEVERRGKERVLEDESRSRDSESTEEDLRINCRLITASGSRMWIGWTGRIVRDLDLVLMSGVILPRRRHSLQDSYGTRLARSLAVAAHEVALHTTSSQRPKNRKGRGTTLTNESTLRVNGFKEATTESQTPLILQMEQEIEEQRAMIDVLAELFPGVMISRIALPSLTYSFANSAYCMRFGEHKRQIINHSGHFQAKIIGRTLEAVRGSDALSILKPQIEICEKQGRQVSFQIRVPPSPPLPPYMYNPDADQEEHMQATLIPDITSGTGEVRGVFEVIQNIAKSEKRQAAEELEYQAHITQTITQNAASCLFMMDHKGFPTFMNAAAERVTGFTLDEIKDKPLHYAVHWKRPDNSFYPMEECPIDNYSVELVAAQGLEEVFVRKDGSLFPVICAVAPLSKGGRVVGTVIEFRDVTEEKRREDERLNALRAAEEHQRTRAAEAESFRIKQERFIDTICHEIRNPINGIYGNVTLLQDELDVIKEKIKSVRWPDKSSMKEAIQQMQQSIEAIGTCARHQKVITDDVLHLSKLEANKIELAKVIFNPIEIIGSAASMFVSQLQAKKLHLRIQEPIPMKDCITDEKPMLVVRGDPNRFMQVVLNLISNAIKFTHVGGIKVCTYYKNHDHETTELKIEVSDTGIGMSKEEQARIFDRFSQASNKTYHNYGGSGLGLSITKGLVNLMGGTVGVTSEEGYGSVFFFNILCGYVTPAQLAKHANEKERSKNQEYKLSNQKKSRLPNRPRRILVTEDNNINKRVIMRMLERQGHYCEAVNNGEEALATFLEALGKGRPFDLVFMDIEMPVMDGMSATKLIRERERTLNIQPIPIIGLSGNSRPQQVEAALASGMSDYITKPYEQETIHSKVEYWTQARRFGSYEEIVSEEKEGKDK